MKLRIFILTILLAISSMFSGLKAQYSLGIAGVNYNPSNHSIKFTAFAQGFDFPNDGTYVTFGFGFTPFEEKYTQTISVWNIQGVDVEFYLPKCIESNEISVSYSQGGDTSPYIFVQSIIQIPIETTIKEKKGRLYDLCGDGSAPMEVSYSGGKAPYRFVNVNTKDTIYNILENQNVKVEANYSHILNVTDSEGCKLETSLSYTWASLDNPVRNVTPSDRLICNGSVDQKFRVNNVVRPSDVYTWYDVFKNEIQKDTSSMLANVCPGWYYVKYTTTLSNPNCPFKSSQLFGAKVPANTVTSLSDAYESTINAYVSNDKLIFDIEFVGSNTQVMVYDTQGVMYVSQAFDSEVSLQGLKSGLYVYRVESKNGVYTGKFMK